MGAETGEWSGVLPRGRWPRLVVAFLAAWIWTTGAYTFQSYGFLWSFIAVVSLVYLLFFGVSVAYWMHRRGKLSLPAYILGAWLTAVPISALFLAMGALGAVGFSMIIATVGGLIGYLIVERTWPKSQRPRTGFAPGHRRVIDPIPQRPASVDIAGEWSGVLPRGRWPRLVVAFLAVWIWTTGMSTLLSESFRFMWSFNAVFSLVYLLFFGVTAAYWMHRWRKLSLLAYILGAWAATVPLNLLFLAMPSFGAVGSTLMLATGGGLIAYLIVERTWPKSQRP